MKTAVIIPCYNEAERLDMALFKNFLSEQPEITFLFVDDGSSDRTTEVISAACGPRMMLLRQPVNGGKGEAVRSGLRQAVSLGFEVVGFWDADLATPLEELIPMRKILTDRPELAMVIGCRLKRLGADVVRGTIRHYVGRCFMTFINFLLDFAVYDSQCGAKLIRAAAAEKITAEVFRTRWLFDLEMLCRLQSECGLDPETAVYEYPLFHWHETGDSKVRIAAVLRDVLHFIQIRRGQFFSKKDENCLKK